jgi:hypothetical protein
MKKTPVELLFDALWTAPKDKFVWQSILKQAKEVEKQEIMIAYDCGADNQYEIVNNIRKHIKFVLKNTTKKATNYDITNTGTESRDRTLVQAKSTK